MLLVVLHALRSINICQNSNLLLSLFYVFVLFSVFSRRPLNKTSNMCSDGWAGAYKHAFSNADKMCPAEKV